MGKLLIITGVILVLAGLMVSGNLGPLGRLPGDVTIKGAGYTIYIPVTSMLLLSILLSVGLWLFNNR